MKKVFLPAFLFLFFCSVCFAWGPSGHSITGAVAFHYLDQNVKDSVEVYFGKTTLEDAANWMDQVRSDPSYDSLKPFHYIDMDKGEEYNPNSDSNIIYELNRVISELKERGKYPKERITMDLKILCHLLGDLHQPLHTGYKADKGGNNVDVRFMGRLSNLHRVWDSDIIDQYNVTAKSCLKVASKFTPDELSKIRQVDIVAWMNESRSYLPMVYNFRKHDIDYFYCQKNEVVIESRLALAGIRMAELLNEVFSK